MNRPPLGVILAGGRGRRMGGADKALLPLAGRPLIAHAVERLAPQVDRLVISANGDPSRFDFLGLTVLADAVAEEAGPLAGILAALLHARAHGCDGHVLSLPVDAPLPPPDLAPRLADAGDAEVVMARADGRVHPATALWSISLAQPLAAALAAGERRVLAFAQGRRHAVVDWSDARKMHFFNANSAAELADLTLLFQSGQT